MRKAFANTSLRVLCWDVKKQGDPCGDVLLLELGGVLRGRKLQRAEKAAPRKEHRRISMNLSEADALIPRHPEEKPWGLGLWGYLAAEPACPPALPRKYVPSISAKLQTHYRHGTLSPKEIKISRMIHCCGWESARDRRGG